MHERLLATAAAPSPGVVLGLLLKPYSLGHDLRLSQLGNPLGESDEATPFQLSEAVLICSQTWRECDRMPWDPLLRFKFWLWGRRMRGLSHQTELAKFIRYRNEGSLEFPPSGVTDPSRSTSTKIAGAPLVLRLQQFLMLHFHLTEEQAWDYPIGLAKCRWGCYWEEQGDWSIYNEAEAKFDAFVRDQERQGASQL